ncbi:hypothetical protein LSH36_95g07050 [Paralvinella palmiformis]|uniref:acid phosphatase n=1 Tax=Paralvinella palmiformis TaxID=53620 RepID=A0AAD9NBZ8_9ANNE|nr:hypothetical protein LSH36_95g07050 [Paralvinella palmiformis]
MTLLLQKHHNLDLPAWATSGLIHQMESLFALLDFYKYNSTLQKRLRGGQLISEYIRLINNKISSQGLPDLEPPKLLMFSVDERTILSLLGSLGVYNNLTVPYSAMVITELYENLDQPGSYHIRFSYHNETAVKPYQLTIKGCVFHCPVSDFIYLMKDIVLDNVDSECRSLNIMIFGISLDNLFNVVLLTIVVGLIVLFLLLLCITCCCTKRWRHRKVRKYGRIRAETVPEEVPMMNTVGNGSDMDD